jgi:flagellar motor protein MotB
MSLRKKHKKHQHTNHIDEKWLVSYSDLMTLLFGFFVLMFSIASKNTGQAEMMSQISQAFNKDQKKTEKPPETPPQDLKATLELKEKELEDLKRQKEEMNRGLASLEDLKKQKEEMSKELELLKTQDLESQKIKQEKEELAKKVQELEQVKDQTKVDVAEKDKLVEKLKELDKLKKKEEVMQAKIKTLEEAEKKAKNEIRSLKDSDGAKTFLLIFAKWETEKHDVDLTVKNPAGKVFSFKNRNFKDSPGELVLDSRYGPGAEIWTSNKLIAGEYEIQITLYNQYGNTNNAKVNTTILAGLNKLILPEAELNLKGKNTAVFKIKIDNEGKISKLN